MAKEFVRIFFAFFKTLSRFLLLLCSCSSCPVSEIDYYSTFCYFQSSHTPMKQKLNKSFTGGFDWLRCFTLSKTIRLGRER